MGRHQAQHPTTRLEKTKKPDFDAIMAELRETVPPEYEVMVDALVEMYETEDRQWLGVLKKLGERGYSKNRVRSFLAHMRSLGDCPHGGTP